jgi:glutaredoxin
MSAASGLSDFLAKWAIWPAMAVSLYQSEHPSLVVLYTRQGCHLCEDALGILHRHGVYPMIVDIDTDPRLRSQFDTCVPVVEIDGRIRFRGKVSPVLLRRQLR